MRWLIDRDANRDEPWLERAAGAPPMPGLGPVLVTLADWLARRDELRAGGRPVGVLLEPADDPAALAPHLSDLALVAVRFPAFADGRGYSTARLLRERLGWTGELRAVGDVLRDQVAALARCGFDTLALRADQDLEAARAAIGEITESYQAGADRGPLFVRRLQPAVQP